MTSKKSQRRNAPLHEKNFEDEDANSVSQDEGSGEAGGEDKLSLILKEIREMREENKKHTLRLKTRYCTDKFEIGQSGRDTPRRKNIRIYGVPEGAEGSTALSVIPFVEQLLRENLDLPTTKDLLIERAHRALAPRPPVDSQPRSIIIRFQSYRIKDEVLRAAWQRKGFTWKGSKINLDHDYAPDVLARRKEYGEIRRVLKASSIRFQTLYPARLKVFLKDETKIYDSVEEAASDLADKGLPVTRVERPVSSLEKLQRYSWMPAPGRRKRGFKEKLQVFRREVSEGTSN
uniref:L1 transposable element RRM domain-containing protein n=1 Tax=Periophthalmus magnuspinnatus TaxID=409849 RepID=A0A3B3ZC08_9GOBI